ncbi:MAG: hypothetical protein ACK476_14045 [Fluviicola sp.]
MNQNEELSNEIKLCVSKIINSRHITLSYIKGIQSESLVDDLLPEIYWERLENENFQEFDDFFDQFRMGNSIFTDFEEVEPILFASIQSTFEFMGILKNRMEDSQLREHGNQ